MRTRHLSPLLGLVLAACGSGLPDETATASWQRIDEAARVWRKGADAWEPPPAAPEAAMADSEVEEAEEVEPVPGESRRDREAKERFERLDERAAWFLRTPYVVSAVQFSCAVSGSWGEDRITAALRGDDLALRLLALTILVRVKAPRTVEEQWATLEDCEALRGHDDLAWLLSEIRRAFSEGTLRATLAAEPPKEQYGGAYPMEWACRAAGVRRHAALLPRLVELSRCDHLHVSLAAQRSLEDFPGREGDEALVACVLGWQYDAYRRSADALLGRNPALLEETLLAATAPDGCVYWQGVFLGRLGSPRAVPYLCQELPRYHIIDREMFDLVEALASAEHLDLIDALPGRARDDQQKRAAAVREKVRSRLGLAAD
jgi:hypothetical protein